VTALNQLSWIGKQFTKSRSANVDLTDGRSRLSVSWVLVGILIFVQATGSAQQAEPSPAATPQQQGTTTGSSTGETPAASPVPAVSPSPEPQQTPQLLPGTNELPAQPAPTPPLRDLIPEGSKPLIPAPLLPSPSSAEQLEKDKFRFREIRTIAVRNPYAIYLLRRALSQSTDELKREYLRVYYITMCDEMRKLEPRLKAVIDAFENLNVGRSAPVGQRPTIPGRDIARYKATERRMFQR
jgi:hypothetical protein